MLQTCRSNRPYLSGSLTSLTSWTLAASTSGGRYLAIAILLGFWGIDANVARAMAPVEVSTSMMPTTRPGSPLLQKAAVSVGMTQRNPGLITRSRERLSRNQPEFTILEGHDRRRMSEYFTAPIRRRAGRQNVSRLCL